MNRRFTDEWVTLEKFEELKGVKPETVRSRRKRGIWPDGTITQYREGRIYASPTRFDLWVEEGSNSIAA